MNLRKLYMDVAIDLANEAKGFELPNPKVGCLVLKSNSILGVGFHKKFGGEHAEVEAFKDALKKTNSLKGSVIYVTLTPCSKTGKTPPCVDLLIKHKIKSVIIGSEDPTDNDAIEKLKKAKINVIQFNVQKAYDLNRSFFFNAKTNTPYVSIKIASTLDGFSSTRSSDSKWITSEKTRTFSRKQRSKYQAILIGANTLSLDNPSLTTRIEKFANPIVFICNPDLSKWKKYKIFNQSNKKIILINSKAKVMDIPNTEFILFETMPFHPKKILEKLWKKGIKSILIEGGSKTQNLFMKYKCVNEVNIFYGNKILGDASGLNIFKYQKLEKMNDLDTLKLIEHKIIDNQIYTKWRIK